MEKVSRMVPANAGTAARKVIIIGGGIAGLSCGCYLQMNGIQSEILEMGMQPGGLCTSWDRGPYVFDGCLRWLFGTNPASAFYQIWMELGAITDRKIMLHDETVWMEGADGTSLSVPADLDRLSSEFKRIAPEDSALIDELVRAARRCVSLEPPLEKPLELMTLLEKIRLGLSYVPILPVFLKWKGLSVAKYLAKYRNAFLRETLLTLASYEHMSAFVLVMILAFRSRRNTGFVVGGSRAFAGAIADRYARLGGVIRYNTRVVSVRVENDRATGVNCDDGIMIPASAVISCADGHTTIFKMLGGRYVDKRLVRLYEQNELFPALIQVSLGIDQEFPGTPQNLSLPLAQPLVVDNQMCHSRMEVSVFGSDAGLCPEGKTVMTVRIATLYDFWIKLKKDNPQGYQAEKEAILQKVIGILDRRFPGLAEQLEQSDVATPTTFARYTANWRGSYEGWLPTARMIGRRIPCTLPGLEDFYMAGHWVVVGGGLPSAALSGRYVAQMICARNGKMFAATKP
ncbi:MAG: NAD(P)/FAD-dependent oxidoreductase [Verrucomicrobia bacterium]|nr:NAD(P)/FAD-dependent oxidoreductase [Verrucomicrobiota bacterium]